MYIPTQFYGKLNSCISASGGDEIGGFISGSTVWKYHKFTTLGSGSFTIHSGSTADARLFLVGGGGGGGYTTEGEGGSPQGAGGGGAGGVIYTDSRLGPGTYTLFVGNGGQERVSGEDTWIQRNPINLSTNTADGGGRGAYFAFDGSGGITNAQNGGSGGGLARGLVIGVGYTNANKGLGIAPQGSNGGGYISTFGTAFEGGAGGGGAAEVAADISNLSVSTNRTRGGNGRAFNVDGTSRYYSGGGGGFNGNTWPTTTSLGSDYYGGGGSGSNSGAGGNPGTIGGHDKRDGRQGIAVVLYPICNLELSNCTTYTFDGNATGGTITYIPCGTSELETATINFDQTGSFCTYVISGEYPTTTGTVSIATAGTCSQDYPIPVVPTCPTGSTLENAYIYDIQIPTACYPTPESCQSLIEASSTVTYTTYDGTAVTSSIGGWFGNGEYQICAREYPAPNLLCGSVGASTTPCTITKTSNVCGYYCSSSV